MIFGTPTIATNGLITYLDAGNRLSYVTGSTVWNDLSGNRISGSFTGSSTLRPSFNSNNLGSITFEGTSSYIDVGTPTILQFTNTQAFSISSWVNWTEGTTAGDYVFAYAGAGAAAGYYIGLDGGAIGLGTNITFFDYYDGSIQRGIQSATNSITKNRWFNLTCTNSGVNSFTGMKAYLNGSLLPTTARAASGTPSSINYSAIRATIGSRATSATIRGNIAQILVYNRELSAQEAQQNYNAFKSRFGIT